MSKVSRGCVLLADVSGTASEIELADLVAGVSESLDDTLSIAAVEAGRVFAFDPRDEMDGEQLLALIERTYSRFAASRRAPDVELRFLVHHGEFHDEAGAAPAGPPVDLLHRLLENTVRLRGYALFTDHAAKATRLDPEAHGMADHPLIYRHYAALGAFVLDLESRPREIEAERLPRPER